MVFMKNVKLAIAKTCLIALVGVTHLNAGESHQIEDKVKDWIGDSSEALNKGVDKLGDDFSAIQDYLNNYHWKGLIQDKATSGPATLKHLELNEHSRAVIVKPGEKIEAEVKCNLDSEKCSIFGVYRIVVGLNGEGAQAVIGNESGLIAGKTIEKFTLTAPEKAGMYQIRFRSVDALFKATALKAWEDENGNEPDGKTTIGVIIVK
jgi:hypothetical protein